MHCPELPHLWRCPRPGWVGPGQLSWGAPSLHQQLGLGEGCRVPSNLSLSIILCVNSGKSFRKDGTLIITTKCP